VNNRLLHLLSTLCIWRQSRRSHPPSLLPVRWSPTTCNVHRWYTCEEKWWQNTVQWVWLSVRLRSSIGGVSRLEIASVRKACDFGVTPGYSRISRHNSLHQDSFGGHSPHQFQRRTLPQQSDDVIVAAAAASAKQRWDRRFQMLFLVATLRPQMKIRNSRSSAWKLCVSMCMAACLPQRLWSSWCAGRTALRALRLLFSGSA